MIGSNPKGAATNGAVDSQGWLRFEADLSLQRLMPRLNDCWESEGLGEDLRHEFQVRLEQHWFPLVHAAAGPVR